MLIKTKILATEKVFAFFKSLSDVVFIYLSISYLSCLNANNCWHDNIYLKDNFRAQLSWAWKNVTSGQGLRIHPKVQEVSRRQVVN